MQQMTHPESKLLRQDIAASAVRLCSARLCIFQYHPTRQTCKNQKEEEEDRFIGFWGQILEGKFDFLPKQILKFQKLFLTTWIWFKRLLNSTKLKPRQETHDYQIMII